MAPTHYDSSDENLPSSHKAPEVEKALQEDGQEAAATHDETRDAGASPREDAANMPNKTAADINAKAAPDDTEAYAKEDTAEARDSRKPYEDVIMPEAYNSSLADSFKKSPDEA